jgi:hypothetical protein
MKLGKKVITSIKIDEDVLKEAKEIGLVISTVCESALKDVIFLNKGYRDSRRKLIIPESESTENFYKNKNDAKT